MIGNFVWEPPTPPMGQNAILVPQDKLPPPGSSLALPTGKQKICDFFTTEESSGIMFGSLRVRGTHQTILRIYEFTSFWSKCASNPSWSQNGIWGTDPLPQNGLPHFSWRVHSPKTQKMTDNFNPNPNWGSQESASVLVRTCGFVTRPVFAGTTKFSRFES